MDTTYTIHLTETQYAALLGRAAELEIPLEEQDGEEEQEEQSYQPGMAW